MSSGSTKSRLSAGSAAASMARSLMRSVALKQILLLKQIWVWPIIAAVVLGLVGWYVRDAIEGVIREDIRADLQTILNADVTALEIWMEAQENTAVSIARDDQVTVSVGRLVEIVGRADVTQLEILQAPELAELRGELEPVVAAHGYDGFLVLGREGKVLAAMRNDPIGLAPTDADSLARLESVFAGNATIVKPMKSVVLLPDENGELKAGVPTMFAFAPVKAGDGAVVAALGLRIRPEKDFTRILRVARAGQSGETYAFDQDGLLISQSRFDEELRQIGLLTEDADSILNVYVRDPGVDLTAGKRPEGPRSEQPLTRMASAAVSGQDGNDVAGYRDYRGKPVIGAWKWLGDYGFGVATEVDVAEAYRPLTILRMAFWGMFALLLAASVAIFVFTVIVARVNRKARRAALEAKRLGQYSLDEKLGEGGMGVVYRAHHDMLHRPTAVKLLDVDKTNEQSIARFEREVRLTSKLNHPNTIAVYDYGRTPEGIFYYAMEYLEGINLDELTGRFGPQPDGRVVYILRQVCASLAEAHGVGLIHRDIKPANIVINARGGLFDFVKLLDFGLVKALDSHRQATLTSAGALTGTPLYMSPEAIETPDTVDPRSDLYAVGAVGFFLLTGSPVFDAKSVLDIIQQHVQAQPEAPSERLGRPISADLERLILRCLAKDPNERPGTALELSAALAGCAVSEAWTEVDAERWWRQNLPGSLPSSSQAPTDDGNLAATVMLPHGSGPNVIPSE